MTSPARTGILALAALLLAACATPGDPGAEPAGSTGAPSGGAPIGTTTGPPAAPGEVIGQGTVLQVGDAPPQWCLGGVMESYPPQCSGPEIAGWDWDLAQGSETASGVTWGAYALTGTWDGAVFTPTAVPILLALYDAMPFADPLEGRQGATAQAELDRIQREIFSSDSEDLVLSGGVDRGFVSVTVVYDDGTVQARMDAEYGPDVVVVQSALRPVA